MRARGERWRARPGRHAGGEQSVRQMGGGRVRQGDIGNMPETSVESSRKKRDLQDEGRQLGDLSDNSL